MNIKNFSLLAVLIFFNSCTSVREYISDLNKGYVDPNVSKITCEEAFKGLSHKEQTKVNTEDFYFKNLQGKRVGWKLKFTEATYDRSRLAESRDKMGTDSGYFLLAFLCPSGGSVTVKYLGDNHAIKTLKKGRDYTIYANINGIDMTLWNMGYTTLWMNSERGILEVENPDLYKKYYSQNEKS